MIDLEIAEIVSFLVFGIAINIVFIVFMGGHALIDTVFRMNDTYFYQDKCVALQKQKIKTKKWFIFIPFGYAYKLLTLYLIYGYSSDFLLARMLYEAILKNNDKLGEK